MPSDWSPAEKKIARRVFDVALHRELAEVMQTFKSSAAKATEPDDMWATQEFLTNARNSIDRKYDYRYSQLEFVFGRLLREGRISEGELAGLSEDKMQCILHISKL
ncbi:hypothetical protein [Sphaerotilus montanus]|uniref:hypothetical protein n=1 Tax=Sphaerotilus montanus TaxID=522889 RepID=UPI003FA1D6F5